MLLATIAAVVLSGCGGSFQPVLTTEGYILSAQKDRDGNPYYIGGSTTGDIVIQWRQVDGSQARAVKPKKGDVVFYVNDGSGWRKLGSKEPIPAPPPGALEKASVPA